MLFDVEEPRAVACAATFAQRVRNEAAFFRKVMELRSELHSTNPQRALLLLLDCFGLSRGESAEILQKPTAATAGRLIAKSIWTEKSKSDWKSSGKSCRCLQQKLAGAKRQDDEPGEVRNLEQEIAALQAEATKLRA